MDSFFFTTAIGNPKKERYEVGKKHNEGIIKRERKEIDFLITEEPLPKSPEWWEQLYPIGPACLPSSPSPSPSHSLPCQMHGKKSLFFVQMGGKGGGEGEKRGMGVFNSHRARELICFVELLADCDLSLSSQIVPIRGEEGEEGVEVEETMELPESCVLCAELHLERALFVNGFCPKYVRVEGVDEEQGEGEARSSPSFSSSPSQKEKERGVVVRVKVERAAEGSVLSHDDIKVLPLSSLPPSLLSSNLYDN